MIRRMEIVAVNEHLYRVLVNGKPIIPANDLATCERIFTSLNKGSK